MAITDHPEPARELPNRNAGRYLRTILGAVEGPEDEVRPSHIAERLDVSPASVTEMTSHLAEDGYVDHEPYGGISLTARGASMARHLQWRQCVFARFFETTLEETLPGPASYEASFALPADVLDSARAYVGMDCKDECDERVWESECWDGPEPAGGETDGPEADVES